MLITAGIYAWFANYAKTHAMPDDCTPANATIEHCEVCDKPFYTWALLALASAGVHILMLLAIIFMDCTLVGLQLPGSLLNCFDSILGCYAIYLVWSGYSIPACAAIAST